jgi:LytS/YehU family sensor histidine kinase
MKSFQQAYESFEKVLKISEENKITFGIALAYSNMSSTMLDLKHPEKAKLLATEAINIAEQHGLKQLLFSSYRYYAEALLLLNDTANAIEILEKYIPELIAIERTDLVAEANKLLAEAYACTNDYQKAYTAISIYAEMNQQINSVEKSKMISELQLRYDTEKKEAAIRELELKKQLAEKKRTEADLQSLKSRMNPHFIYNVMNTIQGLIHLDKKTKAVDAIHRFAHLTRLTLEHSGAKEVSVRDEIMLIKNYVETEQLLMGNSFSYEINYSENIEDDFTFLPSLVVQPIVENAIKHGLMHKEEEKHLQVFFSLNETENTLQITVADNGIGRQASEKLNTQNINKPKSFATNAINQRLQLLNENRSQPISIATVDLKNDSGVSCGTKVTVNIPQQVD